MTDNPYQDYDDPTGSQPSPPGPQPVTDAAGPFSRHAQPPLPPSGGRYADDPFGTQQYGGSHGSSYGTGPQYGPSQYGSQPNPFMDHLPTPYGQNVPPPEIQPHVSNHKLNTWLSVFFPFVSIIFYFVDKDKSRLYDDHLRETMNMGLTRMVIGGTAWFFSSGFLSAVFGLATLVYFILAIMGALEAPNKFLQGEKMQYKGAIPFTRP